MPIAMVIYYNNKLTIIPYGDDFGNKYIETDDNDLLNIEHGCAIESFFDDYDYENDEGEEDSREILKAWIHYCYNKLDVSDIDLSDLRDYFSEYLNVNNTVERCKRIKLT